MPVARPEAGHDATRRRFRPRHRLTESACFKAVFSDGRRSADPLFTVLYKDNALSHARLGLAVSKKSHRRAVARSRLRRLVRESFRHALAELPAVDIVVIARHGAGRNPNAAIAASLSRHWQRIARRAGR